MANTNKGETDFDIDCAYSIVRAIEQIEPETFSLENVREYHKTKSFKIIIEALFDNKYVGNWDILNAADYGVPQSRNRLILMASKIKKPEMPIATHEQNLSDPCFEGFETKQKWIGWYEAIADLIPSLPETKLAKWQLKKLPERLETMQISSDIFGKEIVDYRTTDQPSITVKCGTIGRSRILLVENTGARSDRDLQTRTPEEPSWTIRAMGLDGHWHRANVLTDCKVLAITPHCLARFQSFPDSYILPERKAIAGMIIGNAVPPMLAQRIMEAF